MVSAFEQYQAGGPSLGHQSPLPLEAFEETPETWTQKNWSLSNEDQARRRVFEYVKERLEKTDTHVDFVEDNVYVVWFSFILGNWKALVSTTLPDGMYYEVTRNQTKKETYIDAYKKFDNVCIKD